MHPGNHFSSEFATGNRTRSTNEASDSGLSFELSQKEHERERRSFQRDLQPLRAIGEQSGFKISAIKNGSYVELEASDVGIDGSADRRGNRTAGKRAGGEPALARSATIELLAVAAQHEIPNEASTTATSDS